MSSILLTTWLAILLIAMKSGMMIHGTITSATPAFRKTNLFLMETTITLCKFISQWLITCTTNFATSIVKKSKERTLLTGQMENASVKKGMDGKMSLTSPIAYLAMNFTQDVVIVIRIMTFVKSVFLSMML